MFSIHKGAIATLKGKKMLPIWSRLFPLIVAPFNPFMPSVFSYPYQLDESISNVRAVGGIFHFYSN